MNSHDSAQTDDPTLDVDATLRNDLRARRFLWTSAYFSLTMGGSIVVVLSGFDAYNRSAITGGHFLCVALGLIFVALGFVSLNREGKVVIRWDCHNCAKRLESDVEWTCGSCDRDNEVRSFLDKCAHCKATPKAFECYHCGESTFFLEGERDDRTRARKKTEPRPGETVEEARRREIKEREHERDKLTLDIELAALRAKLSPPKSEKASPRQQRMDRFWRRIEDAEHDCKTVQQTVIRERAMHEEIDSDPDLNESQRNQVKALVSRKFEEIRIELGGDIQI